MMGELRKDQHCIEWISPEIAQRMLEHVKSTSKLDQSTLQAFAHDMKEGRWALNGAPIIISKDGQILDGRMRLSACVKADTPFETVVVRGIEAAAFETIDALRKRTLADILMLRREKHGHPLGAALRILRAYGAREVPGTGRSPTPTALLGVLEEHPGIRESVMPALRAAPLLPHGCGIALHYLASAVDPVRANIFMDRIGNPPTSSPDDPIGRLRETLIEIRGQVRPKKQTYIMAIAIKAMNAFLAGRSIKSLRYSPEKSKFPRMTCERDWGTLGQAIAPKLPETSRSVRSNIRVRLIRINAEAAREMLPDANQDERFNRNISQSVVLKYSRDIEADRWQLNGQTIKISIGGKLLDGQHRLEAVKLTNKSIQTFVVDGLPETVIHSLDIGRKRSTSEVLRKMGESNTIILASALRWYWAVNANVVGPRSISPSTGELLEILSENPEIRRSIRAVSAIRSFSSVSIAAAMHCYFSNIDEDKADRFFDSLITGAELAEGGPILRLRDELSGIRPSPRARMTDSERVMRINTAWNIFVKDGPTRASGQRVRAPNHESASPHAQI